MALPSSSPRVAMTGAGGGFGRALALELARRKAHLFLSDVDESACRQTAELALAAGAASARSMRGDVTNVDDLRALASACDGKVDLVVNNAGVSSGGRVGELPLEDWKWTLDVDLLGVVHGCHVFVPLLREQGHGHVLNVASAAGLLAAPRMAAYNVAKAGVVALSETLAAELHGTKIGVTALCPTFFRTGIAKGGRFTDDKLRAKAEALVERGVSAERVARAALRSVEKNELYSLPMADARWFWRLKRAAPEAYRALVGSLGKRLLA